MAAPSIDPRVMAFRDEREALRARAEAAEEKLADAELEIARLRAASEQRASPAESEAQEPAAPPAPVRWGRWIAGIFVLVAGGGAFFLQLDGSLDHHADATWRAVVVNGGGALEPGTACTLRGQFRGNGKTRVAARAEVRCGGLVAYAADREFGGLVETSPRRCGIWEGVADGGQPGVYHYRLECRDPGRLDLDTAQQRLVVTDARGRRIEMTVDAFSEPRSGAPLYDGNRPATGRSFTAFERRGKVKKTSRPDQVREGALCMLRVEPSYSRAYNCRVQVTCEERTLYGAKGNGFNPCEMSGAAPVRAHDRKGTAAEGDPIMKLDLPAGRVEVSDDIPGAADVLIELDPPTAP